MDLSTPFLMKTQDELSRGTGRTRAALQGAIDYVRSSNNSAVFVCATEQQAGNLLSYLEDWCRTHKESFKVINRRLHFTSLANFRHYEGCAFFFDHYAVERMMTIEVGRRIHAESKLNQIEDIVKRIGTVINEAR